MIHASAETRSATADEMPRALAAIVAAFITDPLARFAWPSPHDHLSAMPLAAREFAGGAFANGTAYLESSNRRNISLYMRHGFEVMGEIQVGAAPPVTPMLRSPR
jgi:hypothetical protein